MLDSARIPYCSTGCGCCVPFPQVPATTHSNRVCANITVCDAPAEFEARVPTPISDRLCVTVPLWNTSLPLSTGGSTGVGISARPKETAGKV